jgi:signal transduction histidine kinase
MYLRLRSEGWTPKSARAFTYRDHHEGSIGAECRVLVLERQLVALRQELAAAREEQAVAARAAEREAMHAASAIARLSAKLDAERTRADEAEAFARAAAHEFETLKETATELARLLQDARSEVDGLRSQTAPGTDPGHAKVGLHQSAPDWLVKAARTAWRKHNHPDVRPAHAKASAEAAFKACEAAFDRLFRMRGMAA